MTRHSWTWNTSCFEALCALPAAQTLRADTVASLLRLAVKQRHVRHAQHLCLLPAAQQLTSQQLCELLQQLLVPRNKEYWVPQQQQELVVQLLQIQASKHLAPGAMLQLLSIVLHTNLSGFKIALRLLSPIDPGSQLTASEVLQLLQQAANGGSLGRASLQYMKLLG